MDKTTQILSPPLQRILAAALSLTVFIQASAPIGGAFGQSALPSASGPAFTFSFELPEGGALDAHHSPFGRRDAISDSLYALRNVAVEDLLQTRKALKILLGGTDRARRRATELSHPSFPGFSIPGGLIDLYLLGRLDRGTDGASAASSARGIVVDPLPIVGEAMRWLDQNEPRFESEQRERLVKGLAFVAAQITKLDVAIRFIEHDYFNDPRIHAEFFQQFIEPTLNAAVAVGNPMPPMGQILELQKSVFLDTHQMREQIELLRAHRQYLFDRYHLLAIEVSGKKLYQHLYEALQHAAGFPNAAARLAAAEGHLAERHEPFAVPTGFQDSVDRALNSLSRREQAASVTSVVSRVNNSLDLALLTSLSANTDRLNELSSEIDYSGNRSSPLLELAKFEELWSTAKERYAYLSGVIDFLRGEREIKAYLTRMDRTRTQVRYAAYGVGVGIGLVAFAAATLATGGTAPVILGISASSWLTASGAVVATQSTIDYLNSSSLASSSRGLFLGTARTSSEARMREHTLLAESDYRSMIAALVTLGASPTVLGALAKGRTLVSAGGRTLVRISQSELALLRTEVQALAGRAEALAPLGRALVNLLRQVAGMSVGQHAVLPLENAIVEAARMARVAPSLIRARLEAHPLVGTLVRGYADRVQADPGFLALMAREQGVGAVIGMISEVTSRGRNFRNEIGEVSVDMASGALATAALVWISAPRASAALQTSVAGLRRPQTIFDPGFSGRERLATFIDRGKTNFLVGMAVNGSVSGVFNGIRYVNGQRTADPNAPTLEGAARDVLAQALYGGTFMAVSSNARYQLLGYLNQRITARLTSRPTSQLILTGLSVGNSYFGGWHYVKLAKMVGVMKSDGSSVPADEANPNPDREAAADVSGLLAQDHGGAYFRVDEDDTSASHLFDFLSDGTAPPPVTP